MASPTDRSVTPVSPNPADMSDDSKGSSVSTVLREEYEDLLRYAVVTPLIDSKVVKHTQKSPEKNVTLVSPKGETVENVARTTPHKTEVKFVDVPISSTSSSCSSSSSNQQDDLADGSCSSFMSEQTKHIVPRPRTPTKSFTHSTNTFNSLATPTVTPIATGAVPHSHHHQHHHHDHQQHTPATTGCLSEVEKMQQQHRHHHHHHHHHVCGQADDSVAVEVQELIVDPELGRLGGEMDACWLELKKRVTAEFEQSRIRVIETQQAQLQQEREKRMIELNLLREEVCRHKEIALTYEQSLSSKDHIIDNLTTGLNKIKDRMQKHHMFSVWHLRHIDEKKDKFSCTIAGKHYRRKLLGRVLGAWSGLIKNTWKLRTEKACQIKAEEVCLELTRQYEEQVEQIKAALEEAERKCAQYKSERDDFEASVKKAFMRGVCALNLEAMTVLKSVDQDQPPLQQGEGQDCKQVPLGHKRVSQASTHLPMLNVEGKGLTSGSSSSQASYPHDSWSKLSKWAESIGPPEPKGHSEKMAGRGGSCRASESTCGGRMPMSARLGGRAPGGSRASKPTPGMCTIKGTVKGYLRPTVVIEKHSD